MTQDLSRSLKGVRGVFPGAFVLLRWLRRRRIALDFRLHGLAAINDRLLKSRDPSPLLKQFGARVGAGGSFYGPLIIHNADRDYGNLWIGDRVHLGRGVLLDLGSELRLEDDCCISMGCTILTHQDIGDRPLARAYPARYEPTTIGRGAYIGADVTVLAGCHIGAMAVIGAGGVVTAPVPPGAVAAGVPARPVNLP